MQMWVCGKESGPGRDPGTATGTGARAQTWAAHLEPMRPGAPTASGAMWKRPGHAHVRLREVAWPNCSRKQGKYQAFFCHGKKISPPRLAMTLPAACPWSPSRAFPQTSCRRPVPGPDSAPEARCGGSPALHGFLALLHNRCWVNSGAEKQGASSARRASHFRPGARRL